MLGPSDIISHKIAQQLRTGSVIGARSLGKRIFQFLIDAEGEGGIRQRSSPPMWRAIHG
jgi:hypothetical protein